jgi:SPP1 gp7 family putative phage head morphogenesis protein
VCKQAVDPLALVHEARLVAGDVLAGVLRLPVAKAMDLRSVRGFDRAVALLAARLRARARVGEEAAVRAAVAELDVDWPATTAAERRALIAGALEAAGLRTAPIADALRVVFGEAARAVVRAGRDEARGPQGLAVAASFNAVDRRIMEHLAGSEAAFVTDEYGRRQDELGERAREIVAEGLEAGLGREEIAEQLAAAARGALTGRSEFYWDVVAGAFIGRGRSYALLSSFAEAGIERYQIEAVLDERTTPICRFLHGKTFSVQTGLDRFEEAEREPERLKEISPWVRDSMDEATGRRALWVPRGGERVVLAEVARSGEGRRDDVGEFARGRSEADLSAAGIGFPPFHGLCRSTCLAVA